MKRNLLILTIAGLLFSAGNSFGQAPQTFKYQAVLRDNMGAPLVNKLVGISINIHQATTTGTVVYSETQAPSSNSVGQVSLNIGQGSITSGVFSSIDWSAGPYFLEISLDAAGGTNYVSMGTSELLSVPYALFSGKTKSADQFVVEGNASIKPDSAIFVVKDKLGQPIFSVFETGVEVTYNILPVKGAKGGFSVGGRSANKGPIESIASMTADSVRIFINPGTVKGAKGGFSVGGRSAAKGSGNDYFAINSGSTADTVNPSIPTILWYPAKSAFLAGQVLIESPDSVGLYSIAVGDSAKAIGMNSQSFGYRTRALGQYSTAIGDQTLATGMSSQAIGNNTVAKGYSSAAFGYFSKALGDYSYAFGDHATAVNSSDYAFGSQSIASGGGSFAMGTPGWSSSTNSYIPTEASGSRSFAFGVGAKALNIADIAVGAGDTAMGGSSLALGMNCVASGSYSIAMGYGAKSTAGISVSMGYNTTASGPFSLANGVNCMASGYASSAIGYDDTATYYYCTAIGFNNYAGIGEAAFATGYETKALNNGATSMGWFTRATGDYSFAGSFATVSSGMASTAFGMQTIARGMGATSMGRFAQANGDNTLALGNSIANSYGSLTLGEYNDTTCNSKTGWFSTDPILSIGNGSSGATHNGFTILKNGNTAIGGSAPTQMLDVFGNARFRSVGTTASLSALYIDANGVLTTNSSDESLKHNFIHISGALDKVMQMNGLYYSWKTDPDNKLKLGFIAQDMEKVVPEAVFTNPVDGLKGINYAELTAVFAEAIKEQQSIIESQQKEIDRLKGLESRISQLEEILNAKK